MHEVGGCMRSRENEVGGASGLGMHEDSGCMRSGGSMRSGRSMRLGVHEVGVCIRACCG